MSKVSLGRQDSKNPVTSRQRHCIISIFITPASESHGFVLKAYKHIRQYSTNPLYSCQGEHKSPLGLFGCVQLVCKQYHNQDAQGCLSASQHNTMQWQGVCPDLAPELHDFLLTLLAPVGKVTRGLLHLPHETHLQCMPGSVGACV